MPTYLALLQPQIVVELQRAAQLLGQIVWLNKLGQTCTRQHQGLWKERRGEGVSELVPLELAGLPRPWSATWHMAPRASPRNLPL